MRLLRACIAAGAVFAAAALLPGAASAANGYATGNVNLRAGPNVDYPRVTTIPTGAALTIHGCLEGWNWCDVSWGPNRGWVSASFIGALYDDRRVAFVDVAPRYRVPIVSFQVQPYWERYYSGRPFYSDRDRYWGGRRDNDRFDRDRFDRDRYDRVDRDRDRDRDWDRGDRGRDRGDRGRDRADDRDRDRGGDRGRDRDRADERPAAPDRQELIRQGVDPRLLGGR